MSPRIISLVSRVSSNLAIGTSGLREFSTTFSATENPVSESGQWTMHGLTTGQDWADCETASGNAFGDGPYAQFADPTALLGGTWHADQEAEGLVFGSGVGSCGSEVEIRLRSVITADVNRGYEVLWAMASTNYVQIVRWNGPLGDFDLLANLGTGPSPTNGDELRARVTGSTNVLIQVFINDNLELDFTDNSVDRWTNGNPGMGFYIGSSCLSETYHNQFGFSSFAARELA